MAGERGLDNIVQFVNVMKCPISCLGTSGRIARDHAVPSANDAAALEALIPKLAEKGLAGLAVTLGYIDQFPPGMVEAADGLGFPLIELPQNISFIDIIQPLTSKILDLQAGEWLNPGISTGSSSIWSCMGAVTPILRLGWRSWSSAPSRSSTGSGGSWRTARYWAKRNCSSGLPGMTRRGILFWRSTGRNSWRAAGERSRTHVGGASRGRDRACGLRHKGRFNDPGPDYRLGAVRSPVTADRFDRDRHGSTVTALKMMEERSLREMEQRFRNEILEGLLSDHQAPIAGGVSIGGNGYRLNPPFALIVVAPDLPPGQLLMKAERLEQSNVNSSLHLAMRYVRAIEPKSVFWYQGPRLVIFLPLQGGRRETGKEFINNELRKVCQRVETENHPYSISMGISSTATELGQFRQAYDWAGQSLEMGKALKGDLPGTVTHYEDLGIFRVASLTASKASMERFCLETMGTLLHHDRQYGTELVRTLRVFLEQNQNSARAARALHIHYNTLRYRLEQIKGLLGEVLAHPQERLVLRSPCKLPRSFPWVELVSQSLC